MDAYLEFAGDFLLTANGDIAPAQGWDEVRQRIERRILTNPASTQSDGTVIPADYIFDQGYGLGARAAVGNTFNSATIQQFIQRIYAGVLEDQGVNTSAPPVVTYTQPSPQEVIFSVQITLASGLQQTILLSLP